MHVAKRDILVPGRRKCVEVPALGFGVDPERLQRLANHIIGGETGKPGTEIGFSVLEKFGQRTVYENDRMICIEQHDACLCVLEGHLELVAMH